VVVEEQGLAALVALLAGKGLAKTMASTTDATCWTTPPAPASGAAGPAAAAAAPPSSPPQPQPQSPARFTPRVHTLVDAVLGGGDGNHVVMVATELGQWTVGCLLTVLELCGTAGVAAAEQVRETAGGGYCEVRALPAVCAGAVRDGSGCSC